MRREYQNIETKKVTAKIEQALFFRIKNKFHYGQITRLIRNVFECVDQLIKEGKLMTIVKFLHKEDSLTLTPVKEEKLKKE